MDKLTSLRNIGEKMEKRLNAVGIFTAQDLAEVGSREAFAKIKAHDPSVCVVYLYALEGAICDTEYNQLPEAVEEDLKRFCERLR